MVKSKEFSSKLKDVIIQQWKSVKSYRKLSVNLKTPHSIVASIVRKYKRFGSVEIPARNGWPRKITSRFERKLLPMVEKNSRKLVRSCKQTYYYQLQSRTSRKTQLLLKRHRDARLKLMRLY